MSNCAGDDPERIYIYTRSSKRTVSVAQVLVQVKYKKCSSINYSMSDLTEHLIADAPMKKKVLPPRREL